MDARPDTRGERPWDVIRLAQALAEHPVLPPVEEIPPKDDRLHALLADLARGSRSTHGETLAQVAQAYGVTLQEIADRAQFLLACLFLVGSGSTHYELLGVPRGASTREIRQRWAALIKRYHPDHAGEASPAIEEGARRLIEAYQTLNDPERRQAYDARIEAPVGAAVPETDEAPPARARLSLSRWRWLALGAVATGLAGWVWAVLTPPPAPLRVPSPPPVPRVAPPARPAAASQPGTTASAEPAAEPRIETARPAPPSDRPGPRPAVVDAAVPATRTPGPQPSPPTAARQTPATRPAPATPVAPPGRGSPAAPPAQKAPGPAVAAARAEPRQEPRPDPAPAASTPQAPAPSQAPGAPAREAAPPPAPQTAGAAPGPAPVPVTPAASPDAGRAAEPAPRATAAVQPPAPPPALDPLPVLEAFRAAYERKDLGAVMRLFSEVPRERKVVGRAAVEHLYATNFRVLDGIRYELRGLAVRPHGAGEHVVVEGQYRIRATRTGDPPGPLDVRGPIRWTLRPEGGALRIFGVDYDVRAEEKAE